jgi:hypothetical protein
MIENCESSEGFISPVAGIRALKPEKLILVIFWVSSIIVIG